MSSRPRYTREQSIQILRAEHRSRSRSWRNLCLALVTQVKGYAYGPASASAFGRLVPAKHKHWNLAGAKRGDILVWVTPGWGHIAVYLGGGWVLCNDNAGNVSKIRVSYYSGLGRPFWVDADAPVWGHSGGVSPLKPPAPAPPRWPMRPGGTYRRVQVLRGAFGMPGGDLYDGQLHARVVAFERKHPRFGPPNGIIGEPEFDAIRDRRG